MSLVASEWGLGGIAERTFRCVGDTALGWVGFCLGKTVFGERGSAMVHEERKVILSESS